MTVHTYGPGDKPCNNEVVIVKLNAHSQWTVDGNNITELFAHTSIIAYIATDWCSHLNSAFLLLWVVTACLDAHTLILLYLAMTCKYYTCCFHFLTYVSMCDTFLNVEVQQVFTSAINLCFGNLVPLASVLRDSSFFKCDYTFKNGIQSLMYCCRKSLCTALETAKFRLCPAAYN